MLFRCTAVALAALGAACAARRPPSSGSAWFELIGEFSMPPVVQSAPLGPARFGGVSGLAYDPRPGPTHNDPIGISDDHDAPRLFMFKLVGRGASFRVELRAYLPLPTRPGTPAGSDAEGIAIARSGRIYIASEGVQALEPRVPPSITVYNRRAEYLGSLPVAERFAPPERGPVTRGVRGNAAFESLALSPDERRLFTATELPLVQDDEPPSFERGALVRILEYEAAGESFRPAREYAYPLDPIAEVPFAPGFAINGAVELVALGARDLLVMERCFVREADVAGRSRTRIRIYRVSLAGATEVSGIDSLRNRADVRPADKALLLDLGDVSGLSPDLAQLDNFEGMALGPPRPDGTRTLLLVSDDNFSTRQRTSFLLFRSRRPLLPQP